MVAVMRLPVGPDPGILPGQALELYVASCCVPVCDVGVEVGFEALEGLPVLAAKEFVLEVSEDLFGGAARGAQVTRPAARRRRPAPPSYPPVVRPSAREPSSTRRSSPCRPRPDRHCPWVRGACRGSVPSWPRCCRLRPLRYGGGSEPTLVGSERARHERE